MTLEWIGDGVLIIVVLPVVIYLLRGVLTAASVIVPSVGRIAAAAQAGSRDLDAAALLLTTQDQAIKTIQVAAGYAGSLEVIIDDADAVGGQSENGHGAPQDVAPVSEPVIAAADESLASEGGPSEGSPPSEGSRRSEDQERDDDGGGE